MATPKRMSPEDQIKARVLRSGKSFLASRKEFASASAQMDSMNADQIAKNKAMLQYKPGKFSEPQPPLPKKKYVPPKGVA